MTREELAVCVMRLGTLSSAFLLRSVETRVSSVEGIPQLEILNEVAYQISLSLDLLFDLLTLK